MPKTYKGEARVYWTIEIPDGFEPEYYEHPAMDVLMHVLSIESSIKVGNNESEPVEVEVEVFEDDIEIEEEDGQEL